MNVPSTICAICNCTQYNESDIIKKKEGVKMSPLSEARRRANEKYNAKAYDEIRSGHLKDKKK
jgi:hypothetical protein